MALNDESSAAAAEELSSVWARRGVGAGNIRPARQREAELLGVVAIARSQPFSRPEPPFDTSMHLHPIDGAVHLEPEPADGTVYR